MNKKIITVGINTGHDGGTAIAVNGKIKCAISEERLNHKKYSKGYLNSFFYCLNSLSLTIKDISLIVFSSYGENLKKDYCGQLKTLGINKRKFTTVNHHLSHAFGAYCLSPFNKALVVVLDGEGNDNETESYFLADNKKIKKIGGNDKNRKTAKGIGRTYESFTNFLGWTDQEAGKTMSLGAFSNNKKFNIPLFDIKNNTVYSKLEHKYEKGVIEFAKKYNLNFGGPYDKGIHSSSQNVAFYIQDETEKIVVKLIKQLINKTGKKNLCLTGGVALNCKANSRIIKEKIIDNLFILPACSDRGQAIGNALYGFYKITGKIPKQPIRNDYFGKKYSDSEIKKALNSKHKTLSQKVIPKKTISYKKASSISKTVATLLAQNKVVAWFQGKSELGPRALGNRSILCNPKNPKMKDLLNKKVKHRESFRPFSPSCLAEKSSEYFNFEKPSPYMLFIADVKKEKTQETPAAIHIDKTARLQTVTKKDNDAFYSLIKEFEKLTGTPILLNTSFNDRCPIVETPEDAISVFLSTDIDFLAIGNYIVSKK